MNSKIINLLKNKQFISLLFIVIFLNSNVYSQEINRKNPSAKKAISENNKLIKKAKIELQKKKAKPELKMASKSNNLLYKPNNISIQAKIDYLKEKSCCEKEILELELKLQN